MFVAAHQSPRPKAAPSCRIPLDPDTTDPPSGEKATELANKLKLPGREDVKVDVLQHVNSWLPNRRIGRWLMMLDNIDDDGVFFDDNPGSRPHEGILPHQGHETILIRSWNKMLLTYSTSSSSAQCFIAI